MKITDGVLAFTAIVGLVIIFIVGMFFAVADTNVKINNLEKENAVLKAKLSVYEKGVK